MSPLRKSNMRSSVGHDERTPAFLVRLARDRSGNVLAIGAAMLIPLIGLTGSAVDAARLYVVRTRLQQACDAGVLAGRKFMTDTSPATALDQAASSQANDFFTNNFREGWFETSAVTFTPTKSTDNGSTVANAVSGSASATVPMAVMHFFGIGDQPVTVQCRAHYDLADTDVMFVLDTTGSMSCVPSAAAGCYGATSEYTRKDGSKWLYSQEASGSKIQGLRDAVKLFEKTMRDNADPSTHVRYGFVTYASSVNVGGVIPTEYLEKNSYEYDTRWIPPNSDYTFQTQNNISTTNVTQSDCTTNKRSPATGYRNLGSYYAAYGWTGTPTWTSANSGTCTGNRQVRRITWRYERRTLDVSTFAAGTPVINPSRVDGSTSRWRGCIEELNTTATANISSDPLMPDLYPDIQPTKGTTGLWRPMWPDVVWARSGAIQNIKDESASENNSYGYNKAFHRALQTACGMPARTLQEMSEAKIKQYVEDEDFRAYGQTYHDIGMIWGARMISPNGVFASTTAAHPGRNPPARNIVFMTDGNMDTSQTSYGTYGLEGVTPRIGGNDAEEQSRHEKRFQAVCSYAKSRLGVTIYVVAFGSSVTLSNSLTSCASPNQAFRASNTDDLKKAFKAIAERVAMLRITQ